MIGLPFTQFYEKAVAEMEARRKKRESESIKKVMASEERMAELSEMVARGQAAKKFVESDFWLDHLQPLLRDEAVLKPAVVRPGEQNIVDRINVEFLIGSGYVGLSVKIIKRLDEWQAEGVEAERLINLEVERRRRLKELGA